MNTVLVISAAAMEKTRADLHVLRRQHGLHLDGCLSLDALRQSGRRRARLAHRRDYPHDRAVDPLRHETNSSAVRRAASRPRSSKREASHEAGAKRVPSGPKVALCQRPAGAYGETYAGQGGILSFTAYIRRPKMSSASLDLSVSPQNFRYVVESLTRRGYRFLTMSALVERLQTANFCDGKVVCLTFDDGFMDTYYECLRHLPRVRVPMTIYLVSSFIRNEFPAWSFALERIIAAQSKIDLPWGVSIETGTRPQKLLAYRGHRIAPRPGAAGRGGAKPATPWAGAMASISSRSATTIC